MWHVLEGVRTHQAQQGSEILNLHGAIPAQQAAQGVHPDAHLRGEVLGAQIAIVSPLAYLVGHRVLPLCRLEPVPVTSRRNDGGAFAPFRGQGLIQPGITLRDLPSHLTEPSEVRGRDEVVARSEPVKPDETAGLSGALYEGLS